MLGSPIFGNSHIGAIPKHNRKVWTFEFTGRVQRYEEYKSITRQIMVPGLDSPKTLNPMVQGVTESHMASEVERCLATRRK